MKDDVQYPEKLHEHNNGLPFLPERIKIKKKMKNLILICMIKYVIHVRNLS